MSEDKRKAIDHIVSNLVQLDMESLKAIKISSDALKARQLMEKKTEEDTKSQETA